MALWRQETWNTQAASFILEMTSIWYPICFHARVYEWDGVLGEMRVGGTRRKWLMKVFLLWDWRDGGTFHETNILFGFIVTNATDGDIHCGVRCCQCLWLNKCQLRWWRSAALDLLLAGKNRCRLQRSLCLCIPVQKNLVGVGMILFCLDICLLFTTKQPGNTLDAIQISPFDATKVATRCPRCL